MSYHNTFRYPQTGDLVTVHHALGEWLVDEVRPVNSWEIQLGLKGQPGSYMWERSIVCRWLRAASAEEKLRHVSAFERVRTVHLR